MSTDKEIQEVYLTDIAEKYKTLRCKKDWMLNSGWLEDMTVHHINLIDDEDLRLLPDI